ncbi:hypothetical protein [Desulfobotulus sp.]|uniref:EF-hand domain-containing protein n=1 Tax=Desulfobotulus sp. TaxID=1940337 RepID=UPI002A369A71|nr:hypothetical protein [Desulfobotulus sp.]MDY0162065.1 hypothetical protein [Desulfobotulus sp.]
MISGVSTRSYAYSIQSRYSGGSVLAGLTEAGNGSSAGSESAAEAASSLQRVQEKGQRPPLGPPPPMGGVDWSMGAPYSVEDMAAEVMAELDADGDALLTLEESGLSEEVWSALDTDGDGQVSSEEVAGGLEETLGRYVMEPPPPPEGSREGGGSPGGMGPPPSSEDMAASLMGELDADGDGQLSLEESGFDEELWVAMDTDRDGYASSAELTAYAESRKSEGGMPPMPPSGDNSAVSAGIRQAGLQAYGAMGLYAATAGSGSLSGLFA